MAINIPQDWQTGKDEYYKLTGEKKPREKIAKFFTTSHTGIHSLLDDLADFSQKAPNQKTAENYLKLKQKYDKAATEYINQLQTLITEESKKTQTGFVVKGDNELGIAKFKTDSYRGLKMLKTKLESYKANFEVHYRTYLIADENKKKVENASFAEGTNRSRVETVEKSFEVRMKNGFARFKAASNALKATPTVEVWNREFTTNEAVRSLTTALAAYKTIKTELEKSNLQLSQEQQRLLLLTTHWYQELAPWGDGAKRKLNQGDNVALERDQASQKVKACAAALGFSI
jgi:hypothetical protein